MRDDSEDGLDGGCSGGAVNCGGAAVFSPTNQPESTSKWRRFGIPPHGMGLIGAAKTSFEALGKTST